MKGLLKTLLTGVINSATRLFEELYRYPFKLVVMPRKLLSDIGHRKNRLSPPGFNHFEPKNPKSPKDYDLYLEPDSLRKIYRISFLLITLSLFSISLYYCSLSIEGFNALIPSILFVLSYSLILTAVEAKYYSYPVFHNNWSRNLECYSDWFVKIPQEVHLHKTHINHVSIRGWLGNKRKLVIERERQPLYYSWESGSPQKGMWLLAIESLISSWDSHGILKKHTSMLVILCPIWASYIALLLVLVVCKIYQLKMISALYIPIIIWLLCSVVYLFMISFFTAERKANEVRTDASIVSFIPYELRSTAPRYNDLYNKFQTKQFLVLSNTLFVILLGFFITLISLMK